VHYNIHDIIRVFSNINNLPDYFKSEPLNVDLTIKEKNFVFKKNKAKRLGLKFYGGNDELYLEYFFYGIPIQKLLIKDLPGKTKFYFTSRTNKLFGVSEIATLLLEIKLLQNGCTLIHSGAISKSKKGYLFSAWSEMGKSSTVFALSKKSEFKVLGDDKVILSKDGTIYSYPEKAGIFFHSKNVENLKLSFSDKIGLVFRFIIAKLPPFYLYVDPNLRIDLSDIVEVDDKAKLKEAYFLEWGDGTDKLDKNVAINKIIASTFQSIFAQYFARETFFAYCYLNDFDPNFIEKGMRKILEKTLDKGVIIRSRKKDFYKYLEKTIR